jgi:TolA-binding protein
LNDGAREITVVGAMQRILRELTRAWMVWVLLCLAIPARAASPDEAKAFEVAVRFFEDRAYDLAERGFAEFIRLHPGSGRVAEALLLQGQALYAQGRYGECLDLLRGRMETAGVLGDLYLYWTAESLYQLGRNQEAAEHYGAVLSNHPESSRRLEASLGEAYATFRLGNLRRTAELLRTQDGAFQLAAADGNPELVARGQLLLAEVCLELGDYLGGIDALTRLPEPGLPPELTWQRQYVLARLQLGSRQVPAALVTVTNLLAQLAPLTNAAAVQLRADARSLEGVLLERSRQPEAAIQAYERNLETEVSPERRFEAVQQIVRLTLVQTRVEEAVARLEDYLRKYPADPLASLLRLALGELRLRQYYGLASNARRSGTNLLQQARVQFGMVITNVGGPYTARAHLNRGWTFWEEAQVTGSTARVADGISDLLRAAEQLPVSEEQAIARFKLGDLLYLQEDYAGAMTNYWQVATNYAELPAVSESLADQARYQLIRAAIATHDLASAKAALEPLLEKAGHPLADRSLLLFGQAVGRVDSGEARQLLTQLIELFPDSGLVPEVKLAIARTYQHEGNWAAAGTEYDRWVTNYPGHSSLARAEFDRAWARYLAGNETNAFQIFTNFVAEYPRHGLTRWAQHWIADYYYRQEKFDLADLNYQQIFLNTNWTTTDLSYHSRLMAGRSAFFRQGYNDARNYFTNLIMDDACPEAIKPEAYFELGNTIMSEKTSGTDPLERYGKAIVAFEKIPQLFPRSLFAPLAWGQIGNCHLQLATADPAQLDRAFEAYTNVLASPMADVSARSAAEIGAATVFEKRAAGASDEMKRGFQDEALSRYLSVFYGGHLREGETADPALVKEAGLAAARLAEDQERWEVATRVYQQLSELLPSMRVIAEARLQRIKQLVSQQER